MEKEADGDLQLGSWNFSVRKVLSQEKDIISDVPYMDLNAIRISGLAVQLGISFCVKVIEFDFLKGFDSFKVMLTNHFRYLHAG